MCRLYIGSVKNIEGLINMEQHEQTEQKLLPIGSVVKFKEWDQTLMIYGRMQNDSKTLKRWDYVACFYPHGNLTADSNIFQP